MGEQSTTSPTAADPPRYCRACGYNLQAHGGGKNSVLSTQSSSLPSRCPECGRTFDPANPRTYRQRPFRHGVRSLRRAAIMVLTPAFLFAAVWLWSYWGWHAEQQALRQLDVAPNDVMRVTYTPLLTSWPRLHFRSVGFVLDRVTSLDLGVKNDLTDFAPLARLTHLRSLDCRHTLLTDLTPLAGLTSLRELSLFDTPVADLAPLAGLTQLQSLNLDMSHITHIGPLASMKNLRRLDLTMTAVTDLSPLAGVTTLQSIDFENTAIADLSPLAGLTELVWLDAEFTKVSDITPLARLSKLQTVQLYRTLVTDPSPLAGLKSLRLVSFSKSKVTEAQTEALRRALPPTTAILWE